MSTHTVKNITIAVLCVIISIVILRAVLAPQTHTYVFHQCPSMPITCNPYVEQTR